jgi:hypothetical protein
MACEYNISNEKIGSGKDADIFLAEKEKRKFALKIFKKPKAIYNPIEIDIQFKLRNEFLMKGEDILAEVFEDIIQKKIERNIRPSFLRNPESGKSLELDCYVPEYKLAIEYNGIQHYKFPSAYHKTEKEFYDQLYRDRLKKKLCDEAGIYLIPVPYWVDMCVSDENDPEKLICSKFVSRDLRYQRIYDFLYDKIEEYFSLIFQSEEKDELENENSYEEESEQNSYEESGDSSNAYEESDSFTKEFYNQEEDYGDRWTINNYE